MPTYHIHIEGQVQGVGFRPFVYRMAKALGVFGTVSNGLDGVHIFFDSGGLHAKEFYALLIEKAPIRARILRHSVRQVEERSFQSFEIIESEEHGYANLLITPDLGLCDDCRQELHYPSDRRYHYPFTTCTNCGPRYSIMSSLPYDRKRTSMDSFVMCQSCQEEYNSPLTRRHYSQTNSCPDCAVKLFYAEDQIGLLAVAKNKELRNTTVTHDWRPILKALAEGQIVAVKGIGGYLLVCDAANSKAIADLRARKLRPSKPFALMYPDLNVLMEDAILSDEETDAFSSIESPIVLLRLKENPKSGIDIAGISPQLARIGAMQPYTPLFELILSEWKKPIVATSGNLSGSPIFFDDENAVNNLGRFVDAFLSNDREILLPQDDSVVQFSRKHRQRIVLRRSRGYAPTYIHSSFPKWKKEVLAMGADLKSAFALQHAGNTYISQYLGDLENLDTQENYELALEHILYLLNSAPGQILVDKHPAYFSNLKGQQFAEKWKIPVYAMQHHEAHFAAVLAENGLLTSETPVLGVVWDGLGWDDNDENVGTGNTWGGEFFIFSEGSIKRSKHFDYFPLLMGDKMSKEPRLSALAICHSLPEAEKWLRPHFTDQEWALYLKMLKKPLAWQTCSVGRLFDCVSALLNVKSKSSFEGEAAMLLEAQAANFEISGKISRNNWTIIPSLSPLSIAKQIIHALDLEIDIHEIAFQFHVALAKVAGDVAEEAGINNLAFSGGVFQNSLLVDLLIDQLSPKYKLHFHKELSPNDECISYGQLALKYLSEKKGDANVTA